MLIKCRKCRDEPAALMEREGGRRGEKERREGERRERDPSLFL